MMIQKPYKYIMGSLEWQSPKPQLDSGTHPQIGCRFEKNIGSEQNAKSKIWKGLQKRCLSHQKHCKDKDEKLCEGMGRSRRRLSQCMVDFP